MEKSITISDIAKILDKSIRKDPELSLNHIYDMGTVWLFSVRKKDDIDLMDPYYVANKKTLKISDFKMLDHLKEFNEALKHKVY